MEQYYNIYRIYANAGIRRRVIHRHVTLEFAQLHCRNPETSSNTATGKAAKARTKRVGLWMDVYDKEK